MARGKLKHRFIAAFTLLEVAVALVVLAVLIPTAAGEAAFTLIEVSMILVILTVMGGVILSKMTQDTRRTKILTLQQKLDRVEHSLQAFAKLNNRLPCPADGTKPRDTSPKFGKEASTPGACVADTSPDSIGANFDDGADTVGGVVPVRTLASYGLSDEDAFDPNGNMLGYFVSKTATQVEAFNNTNASVPMGDIHITDGGGGTRTTNGILLLLSYGPSGHGSFQLSGIRKSTGSTNTDELLNCHCSNAAIATAFDNTFTLHPATVNGSNPLDAFDDTGRYFTRSFFTFTMTPDPSPAPAPAPAPYPDVLPDSA